MSDDERFTCPRRAEDVRPIVENQDTWVSHRGLVGQLLGCSYCGSMPPGDFLNAVKAGAQIDPTDKSYKAYVHLPAPDPEALRVTGMSTSPFAGLTAYADLTEAEKAVVREHHTMFPERAEDGYYSLAPWGSIVEAKFYFQHLSADQRQEFLDLVNARKVTFGYPGHFYVLPYFAVPASQP